MLGMNVEKKNANSVNAVRLKKKKTKYLSQEKNKYNVKNKTSCIFDLHFKRVLEKKIHLNGVSERTQSEVHHHVNAFASKEPAKPVCSTPETHLSHGRTQLFLLFHDDELQLNHKIEDDCNVQPNQETELHDFPNKTK
jgi:hypothetical protein